MAVFTVVVMGVSVCVLSSLHAACCVMVQMQYMRTQVCRGKCRGRYRLHHYRRMLSLPVHLLAKRHKISGFCQSVVSKGLHFKVFGAILV